MWYNIYVRESNETGETKMKKIIKKAGYFTLIANVLSDGSACYDIETENGIASNEEKALAALKFFELNVCAMLALK